MGASWPRTNPSPSATSTKNNLRIGLRVRHSIQIVFSQAAEEIVLDQNELAAGKKFHALGGMDVSPDGSKLLYLEDLTAFREYTLHVRDLAQGRNIDSIPNVWNGTAWADDNQTFFYMTADAAKRGNAVWRHVIGSPRGEEVNVFREDNNLYNVTVLRSRSEKFIFIPADGFTSSEWRAIPSATPAVAPKVIQPRRPDVEYSVEHGGGFFNIHTNDQAKNFKIVRVPDSDPAAIKRQDWVPHRPEVFVEGVEVFSRFAVVIERRGGLRRLRVVSLQGNASHDVAFPEPAYGVSPTNNLEFDTDLFRFNYSSLVTPSSVFDYNMASRQQEFEEASGDSQRLRSVAV